MLSQCKQQSHVMKYYADTEVRNQHFSSRLEASPRDIIEREEWKQVEKKTSLNLKSIYDEHRTPLIHLYSVWMGTCASSRKRSFRH